jgi:hypothetical protein
MQFFEQDNPEYNGGERVRRDQSLSDIRGEVPHDLSLPARRAIAALGARQGVSAWL